MTTATLTLCGCGCCQASFAAGLCEIERLRAIIEGRTTPPSQRELDHHRKRNGVGWWLVASNDLFTVECRPDVLAEFAERCCTRMLPWRWIPLDDAGRPIAWPVVSPAADAHPWPVTRDPDAV